jgi:hypothetical protein
VSPRQRDLSQNRPPSAMPNSSARTPNPAMGNAASQRAGNSSRTWEAQGNVSDNGHPPAGFGASNRPVDPPTQTPGMNNANRPPSARGDLQSGAAGGQASRPSTPSYSSNRPTPSNNGRSYEPPQRTNGNTPSYDNRGTSSAGRSYEPSQRTYGNTPNYDNRGSAQAQPHSYNPPPTRSYSPPSQSYSAPSRNYSAPSRSYSAPSPSYSAPSRSYSAPSPSYSAPSRSYSAPSPSYSSGGGGNRGGNGGGNSGSGGGSSRGGGGSGPHGHN